MYYTSRALVPWSVVHYYYIGSRSLIMNLKKVGLIYEMTKLFAKARLQSSMITVITLKEALWCIFQASKELKII